MKRRFWIWSLFLILAYLQYRLWFSQHGILYYWGLQDDVHNQTQINAKAEACNKMLENEILYFRNNPNALEERARYELDMIKKDEVFVHIDGEPTGSQSTRFSEQCDSLQ